MASLLKVPSRPWQLQCQYLLSKKSQCQKQVAFNRHRHLALSDCIRHCKRHFFSASYCKYSYSMQRILDSHRVLQRHLKLQTSCYATKWDHYTLQNNLFRAYLEHLEAEFTSERKEYGENLSEGRNAALRLIVDHLNEARAKYEELKELEEMEKDESLKDIVVEDKERCMQEIKDIESTIVEMLLPAENKYDNRDVILEVECGAGGVESMMFAYEIFTMYKEYADFKSWTTDVMGIDKGNLINEPAIRKASLSISGTGVYGRLKFEGGVHRVKRNPINDPSRIHTSTVSVAVLFQPTQIDLNLDEKKDLKIETCGASGPGGQNVQKSETMVRIKHIPTGIIAECQDTRSQHKNKEKALQTLKARLMSMELEKMQSKTKQQRKIQVGGKDRSERIRTYQYSKDIVIEHRLNKQFRNIEDFLTGGTALDTMIDELRDEADLESLNLRLEEFEQNSSKAKTKTQ